MQEYDKEKTSPVVKEKKVVRERSNTGSYILATIGLILAFAAVMFTVFDGNDTLKEVETPDINIEAPEVETPDVEVPEVDISAPEVEKSTN